MPSMCSQVTKGILTACMLIRQGHSKVTAPIAPFSNAGLYCSTVPGGVVAIFG